MYLGTVDGFMTPTATANFQGADMNREDKIYIALGLLFTWILSIVLSITSDMASLAHKNQIIKAIERQNSR